MKFNIKQCIFSSFLLVFALLITNNLAFAAMEDAVEINLNQSVTGQLVDYNDKDYYQFTLPTDGIVILGMKHVALTNLQVELLNNNGEVYESVQTDSSGQKQGFATAQVGLPKGTYYILVEDDSYFLKKPYEFKVEFNPNNNNFEKEFNNSVDTANEMKLNQIYYGTISGYSDKDYFQITLPSDGIASLGMKHQSNVRWNVEIRDGNGNIFENIITDSSGQKLGFGTVSVGLPKGTYFVRVENNELFSEKKQYEVKVDFETSNNYEREFNDSIDKANEIKLNESNQGKMKDYNDKDIYKFRVPNTGKIVLSFEQQAGIRWYAHIQDSTGKVISEVATDVESTHSGINAIPEVTLPKGTYFLVVSISMWNFVDEKPYTFNISLKSLPVKTSQVKVINYKGKSDMITLTGIAKDDVIKVYNDSKKGSVLATGKASGTSLQLSVKELGKKAGTIYVTITKPGTLESSRVAIKFSSEK